MASWSLRARVSVGCLGLFCVCMLGAMWSYAGGSWLHPRAASHAFWENFWCDLLREPAHNGRPNARSVTLGTLGFATLSLALAAFWLEVAELLGRRSRAFVRAGGLISSLATAAVALLPSDRFPALHAPAVLSAGGLGFACGCVCSLWALRHFRVAPWFAACALLLVATAAVNMALYVNVVYLGGRDTIVLPAVQKVASIALIAWLLSGLLAVNASRPKP